MPIKLFHITSLHRSISIIHERVFKPGFQNPLAQDSGLNAGLVGSQLVPQEFEATGVKLIFEFDGPLIPMHSFPLTVGSVYNGLPYRVVVPFGTVQGLSIVDLVLDEGTSWLEQIPSAHWWVIGKKWQENWRNNMALLLENEIRNILSEKPAIRIGT